MTIIVPSAAAPIHRVIVFSCFVSGVCSLAVVASMPAILPTSASAPVAVTSIMPLPCVTGVFMNAMFVRSPGPSSASASASVSFDAGVLSPVSADSSMSSELAWMILPSAATSSPALISTTSPTTTSSAGICRLGPVAAHPRGLLRQRLQGVHRALGLALLTETDDGVEHGQQDQHGARAPLADGERRRRPAMSRMICM